MIIIRNYRLMSMPSAQCYVEICKEWDEPSDTEIKAAPHRVTITLVSYSTRVCSIVLDPVASPPKMAVLASGTYSNTTARHITRFTQEFFGASLYNTIRDVTRAMGENTYVVKGQRMALCVATSEVGRIAKTMQKVFDYTQNAKRFTGKYC